MLWGSWKVRWTESPDRLKRLLALRSRRDRVGMRADALVRTFTTLGNLRNPVLARVPVFFDAGMVTRLAK